MDFISLKVGPFSFAPKPNIFEESEEQEARFEDRFDRKKGRTDGRKDGRIFQWSLNYFLVLKVGADWNELFETK
jgi:hypothetical protein